MKEMLEKITGETTVSKAEHAHISVDRLASVLADFEKRIEELEEWKEYLNPSPSIDKPAFGEYQTKLEEEFKPAREECEKCGLLKSTVEAYDLTNCEHKFKPIK